MGLALGHAGCESTGTKDALQESRERELRMQAELKELEARTGQLEAETRAREAREQQARDQKLVVEAEPVEVPVEVVNEIVFTDYGPSAGAASKAVSAQVRRSLFDQVRGWVRNVESRASGRFSLRNPVGFSSHFTLASDTVLDEWSFQVVNGGRSAGESAATVRVDMDALESWFRGYLARAASYVSSSDRQRFLEWCDTVTP
jgi:hypothetical protein